MTSTTPSPTTWTLRLKCQKTTVLLHIDPLHTFSTIKTHLYTALQETTLKHAETREPIPLPFSPSEIQFGRPVDPSTSAAGFQLGEWEFSAAEDDEDEDVKGKGKAKKGVGKPSQKAEDGVAAPGTISECPKGAGLRDGTVLTFRWRGEGMEEAWGDEDVDMKSDGGSEPDMWGVKIARFEDAYGVENEGDVGAPREFEG